MIPRGPHHVVSTTRSTWALSLWGTRWLGMPRYSVSRAGPGASWDPGAGLPADLRLGAGLGEAVRQQLLDLSARLSAGRSARVRGAAAVAPDECQHSGQVTTWSPQIGTRSGS